MIIYETTNLINGKKYIGKDKHNNPNYYGSGIVISRDIKKYGKENFKKVILEQCDSYDHMNGRESYWIDKVNAIDNRNYYNIMAGGQGGDSNTKHSPEWYEKMKNNSGENNPNFGGKSFTAYSLKKLSEASMGENNGMHDKQHKQESKDLMAKKAKDRYTLQWFIEKCGDEGQRMYDERNVKLSEDRMGDKNPFYGKTWGYGKHPMFKDIPSQELGSLILEGKTQKEIAEHFNISAPTIARKIKDYWGYSWKEAQDAKREMTTPPMKVELQKENK